MKYKLKQALTQRRKQYISVTNRVPAAVILPVYYNSEQGEYYILFTKRTSQVRDHKGEISFPGGVHEDGDNTLLDTALRECAEEISLPSAEIEVLGELDDAITLTSDYYIAPFVAFIPWPYQFRINNLEIERMVAVPVSALMAGDSLREEAYVLDGEAFTLYYYQYEGDIIFGATARILNQFLDIYGRLLEGQVGG